MSEVREIPTDQFGWKAERIDRAAEDLASFTQRAVPSQRLTVVTADPDDDRILECAVASRSSVIVSSDKHLLAPGCWVTPIPQRARVDALFIKDLRHAHEIELDAFRMRAWRGRVLKVGTKVLSRLL